MLATFVAGLAVSGFNPAATCETAMLGHGTAAWRSESLTAGPLGVRRNALRTMDRTKKGLVTKLPVLVEGREPVTIDVPPKLRRRVFLYYGPPSNFARDRGFTTVEFYPCGNRPRTIWPGGIRVKGDAPVRLDVYTEVREFPFVLPLGKPKVFEPERRWKLKQ